MYKNVRSTIMKTENESTFKTSGKGRRALLLATWPVIFTVMLLALPAKAGLVTIDPGVYPDNTDLTNAYPDVTLIAEIPAIPGSWVTNSSPPFEPTMFIMAFAPWRTGRLLDRRPLFREDLPCRLCPGDELRFDRYAGWRFHKNSRPVGFTSDLLGLIY